jgi:hypothetical protein
MGPALKEPPPVAKKKGVSVQIDEDVVKSARLVSALIDRPIAALISEILRPILAKMEAEELAKRTRPKGGKP